MLHVFGSTAKGIQDATTSRLQIAGIVASM